MFGVAICGVFGVEPLKSNENLHLKPSHKVIGPPLSVLAKVIELKVEYWTLRLIEKLQGR